MDPKLIEQINSYSTQGPLPQNLEEKIKNYKAKKRLIFYDVPQLDINHLYEFCDKFDIFGKDPEQTRRFIQLYIINEFMGDLNRHKESLNLSVEPVDISDRNRCGAYSLKHINSGLSIKITKMQGELETPVCVLDPIFRIQDRTGSTIVLSYAGSMRNWQLAYTDKFKGNIPIRWGKGMRPYEKFDKIDRLQGDKFLIMSGLMVSLFPEENHIILFAYSRRQFEKQFQRYSPIPFILGRHKNINMLIHTIGWAEIDELSKLLLSGYKTSQPTIIKPKSIDQYIANAPEGDSFFCIKEVVLTYLSEFAYQLGQYLLDCHPERIIEHPNKQVYLDIMEAVPENFLSQRGRSSFLYQQFYLPVRRIVKVIDRLVEDQNEATIRLVLRLPEFHGSSPELIMNSSIFPYNFPHIYLGALAQHMKKFGGTTIGSLEEHMKAFYEEIGPASERDIYTKLVRLPGSYGTGKRR